MNDWAAHVGLIVPLPESVQAIYDAVQKLEEQYKHTGRKFTPDGHLVGSIGEVIAAEAFKLELLPMSAGAHDAKTQDGRRVQIKLTGGNGIAMNAPADNLLVLKIVDASSAEVVYFGDGMSVWNACGSMQKNGQRRIGLSRLKQLAQSSS